MNIPTHNAFIVVENQGGEKPVWFKVGSVFAHKNGEGFDIVVPRGISVTGRIVCTKPKEKDAISQTV